MRVRANWATAGALTMVIAMSGATAHALPADEPSPDEIFEKAAPATVHLIVTTANGEALGAGFVYDADEGLVVTNAHVVDGLAALKTPSTPLNSTRSSGTRGAPTWCCRTSGVARKG